MQVGRRFVGASSCAVSTPLKIPGRFAVLAVMNALVRSLLHRFWRVQVSDSEGVKVRAGPSTRARRFCTFDSGTLVQVAGRLDFDGGWLCLKVSPPSAAGHSGTVNDHGVVCCVPCIVSHFFSY